MAITCLLLLIVWHSARLRFLIIPGLKTKHARSRGVKAAGSRGQSAVRTLGSSRSTSSIGNALAATALLTLPFYLRFSIPRLTYELPTPSTETPVDGDPGPASRGEVT